MCPLPVNAVQMFIVQINKFPSCVFNFTDCKSCAYLFLIIKKKQNKNAARTLSGVRVTSWRPHDKRRGSHRAPGNDPSQNSS